MGKCDAMAAVFPGAARARVSDIGKGGRHNKWAIIITIIVLVKLVHSSPTRALPSVR